MTRTTIRSEDITAGQVKAADLASDAVTPFDDNQLKEEIALLGFRTAANGSLAKYNLVDQTIDAFQDATGIDAGSSTDEIRNNNDFYSGGVAGNYFGNGELGTVTFGASSISQTGDTVAIDTKLTTGSEAGGPGSSRYGGNASDTGGNTITINNPSSCYELTVSGGTSAITSNSGTTDGSSINSDGDMVLAEFDTLTIDANVTLTTDAPCRGLFIYVKNDCTINGCLSVTHRGAKADPTVSGGSDSNAVGANGLQLGLLTSGGTSSFTNDGTGFNGTGTSLRSVINLNQDNISSNGDIFTVSRSGASGGAQSNCQGGGNQGSDVTTGGVTLSSGGGGSGGVSHNNSVTGCPLYGGAGGSGTCFSGGSGGGGAHNNNSSTSGSGTAGSSTGGVGGTGFTATNSMAMGGAGNPGGAGTAQSTANIGSDGTGGTVWLLVGGNLTIGSGGSIDARGQGKNRAGSGGGGGSGGGTVMALYVGTLTNNGSITVTGGVGENWPSAAGAISGGDGGSHIAAISQGTLYNNMTLISNATTAQAAPTKADLVMTYTNGAGTATINTDLKAYASRDDGTTWTQLTLASQGSTGAHTILSAHDLDISGQPSGTDMRYKITTHNQSASKQTRIHAVSLGWS